MNFLRSFWRRSNSGRNAEGTRTDISALFTRHVSASETGRALNKLASEGLAKSQQERTEGRTAERWFYVPSMAK